MVRLAHISDVHVTAPRLDWRLRDLTSKRLTSWVNFRWLGRRKRFLHAEHILARLVAELPDRGIDHVVFSGDATALGFKAEFHRAAQVLHVGRVAGIAVPGNHDYCTRAAARSGYFEHSFAPWQHGKRIGHARYPFAQRVGPLWLVGVNAAIGHRIPWDASGRVGLEQIERLKTLLAQLDAGPRVLVIHYPMCLPTGRRESASHGLHDLRRVVQVASEGGVRLWLHGHQHVPYHFQATSFAPFPVVCAGSTTQNGIGSYNEYAIDGERVDVLRRTFDAESDRFRDAEAFTLTM